MASRSPEVLVVANVQLAGIAQRLEVPGRMAAAPQRLVDEAPALLARDHRGRQGGEVPAAAGLGAEFPQALAVRRERREIAQLVGILGEIVELIRVGRTVHEFMTPALDHHQGRDRALAEVFADDFIAAGRPVKLRHQARAVQGVAPAAMGTPASSLKVGNRSTSDAEPATRRAANLPGACTMKGIRHAGSKKFILYQSPRSPSMSP